MLRGEGYERGEALSEEERSRCEQLVSSYMKEEDQSAMLNPGDGQDPARFVPEKARSGGGVEEARRRCAESDDREERCSSSSEITRSHPRFDAQQEWSNAAAAAAAAASRRCRLAPHARADAARPGEWQRQAGAGNAQARGGGACPAPPLSHRRRRAAAVEREEQALAAAGAGRAGDALLERNAAFEQFRRSYRKPSHRGQ